MSVYVMILMNLPNKLTVSRFFLTGLAIIFFYLPGFEFKLGALVLFLAAIITDQLDGILAIKLNQKSFFGKMFDQTADKILVNLFWLILLDINLLPFWLVALNLAREIFVASVRGVVGEKGIILASKKTGKSETAGRIKAALQMLVILLGLIFVVAYYNPLSITASIPLYLIDSIFWIAVVAVAFSYFALADFLWKYKEIILKDA